MVRSSGYASLPNFGRSGCIFAETVSMKTPWTPVISEMVGTALLVGVGLSIVILDFSPTSPIVGILPDPGLRRLITGFLFGTTGGLIAVSAIGKWSGAHINPVVTMAFWLHGKFHTAHALRFVAAQLVGAALGALPLLLWGHLGASVDYGATMPGSNYGPLWAMLGEVVTTYALILGLFVFLGHRGLRRFTPMLFPFLYAVMVYLEAPVSGTSTNPARSFGPSLISGAWPAWWVYWIGPIAGAALGVLTYQFSWLRKLEFEVAKVYHFELDPHGLFGSRPGGKR
jgi:aquaporin Z